MLANMAVADIRAGGGLTVIDPAGQLVDDLLELIPRERTNDVIYFNPFRLDRVVGINILEPVGPESRANVVSALISIFRNLWPEAWGPRSEFILSNCAFALLEQPQPATLLAIPKLLTDTDYRHRVLRYVSDPAVRWFFDVYDHHWSAHLREEAIAPVLNKTDKFMANPLLRAVIGHARSSFDFRWMMDHNKIFLCQLAKGVLGEDVSSLLGSLIVTKLSLAALARADTPEPKRIPHVLYADEVQNFVYGMDLPTILAEARKYRLILTIGTQTIGILPEKTVQSIFGNCATVMSFRVSGDDAERLRHEFAMMMPASELQDLSDYKAYVRTMSGRDPVGPYVVNTFPPFEKIGDENDREMVIQTSLARYARPRALVERRIKKFLSGLNFS